MEPSDWFSGLTAIVALAALVLSLLNRRDANRHRSDDIAREHDFQLRVRVWKILDAEPGYRTISALDSPDGHTAKRITLLRRTVHDLKLAGASGLAEQLDRVLRATWPSPNEESAHVREEFRRAAEGFLEPSPDRVEPGASVGRGSRQRS
jgi:hypothetical protein